MGAARGVVRGAEAFQVSPMAVPSGAAVWSILRSTQRPGAAPGVMLANDDPTGAAPLAWDKIAEGLGIGQTTLTGYNAEV